MSLNLSLLPRRHFEGYWDEFFRALEPTTRSERDLTVRTDARETDKAYLLNFDLPGVNKEDFKVEYDRGVLTVSGERKSASEESAENRSDEWLLSERRHGKFSRSFRLPEAIDSDKIEAEYKDGVLKVSVPKSEAAKPRTINIAS